MSEIENLVQQSLANTVSKPASDTQGGFRVFSYLTKAGMSLYPWWSPSRDIQLMKLWKEVDYLSGAIYTMESKMSSIPVRVQARDQSIVEHVREAEDETERLLVGAEFGSGWTSFYEKFVEALITQDNGAFVEIIGAGRPDGPIIGRPVTVRTLDPAQCQRTGDPEFPVIYHESGGKMYKLHFTRVIYKSQMESTIEQMFGVGFCAISRAVNTSQSLLDILLFKQEKMGSRPRRGILVTGGGLDPEDVSSSFKIVESIEDNQGLSRYSKIAVVGESSLPDAKLTLMDLSGLPDGFNERDNVELGMAVISMALGMDARELFPALQSGATRADALIQHLKQRGKGPGQIIQLTELSFNSKYLPPHLKMVFDFQDDEEDRQSAETKEIRSRRWSTAIKDESMDNHTARAQMVEVGDLERGQYERLELEDGRLADGTSVLALFYSDDPNIKSLLAIGVDDPLDVMTNSWEMIKSKVDKQFIDAMTIVVNSPNPDERWYAHKALAALRALRKLYGQPDFLDTKSPPANQSLPAGPQGDGTTNPDPRLRKTDLMRPQAPKISTTELQPTSDEQVKEDSESSVPFEVDLTMLLKTIEGYRLNIRAAVRGLWMGVFDYYNFLDQMSLAIERGFTQAWYEGARIYGVNPSELTQEEHDRITSEVNTERGFVPALGQAILANTKANGGKLAPLFSRAELWISGYNRVRILGSTYAAKDQKQEWVYGDTQHCPDCLMYNGKVYRASTWMKHNIQPKMYALNCHGYHCQCKFVPTNKPCNKGYPPAPRG